jgi:flavin-binding protein dodecin
LEEAVPIRKRRIGLQHAKEDDMTVAKITEISASSEKSFQDAIESGIVRASKTLEGISGAWVNEMKVDVKNGRIHRYRVNMKVTFVLND